MADDGKSITDKQIQIPNWIWVILGIIIIIVLFGLYIHYYYTAPESNVIKGSANEYHPTFAWGQPSTVTGAIPKGFQFPVSTNPNGNINLTPAVLNSTVLSYPDQHGIKEGPAYPCIDIDQLNAIQVEHTCDQYPTNISRDLTGPTNCITVDGKPVPPDTTETYYAVCNEKGIIKNTTMFCPGQVGGVAVNFNKGSKGTYDKLYCLKKNDNDNLVSVGECNLAEEPYQFRIILTTPKTWPGYGTSYGSTGTTGTLAAFVHRATGLCVDIIDPKYKGSQGLSLKDCNTMYNYGYTWQLFSPTNLTCLFQAPTKIPAGKTYQSMQYDPSAPNGIGDSSAGCPLVKSDDIHSWAGSPLTDDPDQSIYSYTTLSPQQIVYIGYADGAEQTYKPKSILDTVSFFYKYNGMSLTCSDNKTPLTKPFARWETYYGNSPTPLINNKIFNAQTASFLTYNFIYGASYATPF